MLGFKMVLNIGFDHLASHCALGSVVVLFTKEIRHEQRKNLHG